MYFCEDLEAIEHEVWYHDLPYQEHRGAACEKDGKHVSNEETGRDMPFQHEHSGFERREASCASGGI